MTKSLLVGGRRWTHLEHRLFGGVASTSLTAAWPDDIYLRWCWRWELGEEHTHKEALAMHGGGDTCGQLGWIPRRVPIFEGLRTVHRDTIRSVLRIDGQFYE